MRIMLVLRNRLRSLLRRSQQESELRREIEIHLEQLTRELIADGMSPSEARREATRRFGPIEVTKENCRDELRVGFVEDMFKDMLFSMRLFRKSPTFTLTAIISLALGIGANVAIFQLFEAVRLRSLPVEHPEQLVSVHIIGEGRSGNFRGRNSQFTNSVWEELRRRQRGFAGLLAYGDTPVNLAPSGEMRNVEGLWVSGSFFSVLGVEPYLGRLLSTIDDRPGCGWPGVVISHAFWQREFGGDENVLARTLTIDGPPVPIIGVTPPEFFGVEVGRRFDVAMPICSVAASDLNNRMFWFLSVMGRLKPGVSEAAVRADLTSISAGIFESTIPPYQPAEQARYAKLRLDFKARAGGQSEFRDAFAQPLMLLLCMVMSVLLLACANLANMMLARATAREHEFAIRKSLGASRWRLIRQVLLESLLLSIAGAGLGAMVAPGINRVLVSMLSTARDPIFLPLEPNWRLLAYTIAAAVAATISFGLAPAFRAGRTEARGASASREKLMFRQVLLAVQVGLCMVLLTGALLFSRSFQNLLTAETGFEPRGILVVNTYLDARHYPVDRRRPVIENLQERLRAVPGVAGVARSYVIPISGSGWDRGVRLNATDAPREVNLTSISEGYFGVMHTPMLAGRDFNTTDRTTTKPVAIVNQTFAKTFFGGRNPVGKIFRLDGPEPPFEIIGLVGNAKYRDLSEEFSPIVYLSANQEAAPRTTVRYLVRSTSSPEALMNPIRQVVAGVDPQLSMRFAVLEAQLKESILRERLMATLTTAFGVLGAMVALTGVFGVTAYVVARRYREFGVRIALGATRGGIIRMVLGELALVLLAGVIVGGVVAVVAGQAASTLLYGVKPHDATTMLIVIVLLGSGGLIAGLIPALRASSVAPVEALRVE